MSKEWAIEPARLARVLPPGTTSFCLFATTCSPVAVAVPEVVKNALTDGATTTSSSRTGMRAWNVDAYVHELALHGNFDRVIVLEVKCSDVGDDADDADDADDVIVVQKEVGTPTTIVRCRVPNMCLDFGAYWRVLGAVLAAGRAREFTRVGLVNDSCLVVRGMGPLFAWGTARPFWGVTYSLDVAPHLQSYFLIFDGAASVGALMSFVRATDVAPFATRTKRALIVSFEVGLSRYMAARGFELAGRYSSASLATCTSLPANYDKLRRAPCGTNPAHCMWDRMLAEGCPLVKRARRNFSGDLAFILRFAEPRMVAHVVAADTP